MASAGLARLHLLGLDGCSAFPWRRNGCGFLTVLSRKPPQQQQQHVLSLRSSACHATTLGPWRELLLADALAVGEGQEEDTIDDGEEYSSEAENPEQEAEASAGSLSKLLQGISSLKSYQVIRIPRMLKLWSRAGNELSRESVNYLITELHKRKLHVHALEIADWVKEFKLFRRTQEDEVLRLEVAANCGSLEKAEKIFNRLSPQHRSEAVHNALLLAYVNKMRVKGAEKVYNRLKSLSGLITSCYAFNLMALLYREKKLEERILRLVDDAAELGIGLDTGFNNNLLLANCKVRGIESAQELFASMVSQGNYNFLTYLSMAKCYGSSGQTDKALEILRLAEQGMEAGQFTKQRRRYNALFSMYGELEDVEGLERAWQSLVRFRAPNTEDYYCMMKACGKAGQVERAEAVFREAEANDSNLKYSPIFNALMYVYSTLDVTDKADALVWRMEEELCVPLDNWCYHHLVFLYCKTGKVDQAARVLRRAQAAGRTALESRKRQAPRLTPFPWTIWLVLDAYASSGDVEGAEAAFKSWRKAGYKAQTMLYNRLLKAYLVASRPVYQFVERMLHDGVRPNSETEVLFAELKAKVQQLV